MAELNPKDASFRPQTLGKPEIDDDELEQYGVWVKAGPEDILEGEEVEAPQDFSLQDLENEDTGGSSLLSDEEEELLGSLETEEAGSQDMSEDFGLPDELDDVDLSALNDTDITEFEEKLEEETDLPEIDIDLELEEEEAVKKEEAVDLELPEIDELEDTMVLDDVESLPGEENAEASAQLEIGEIKDLETPDLQGEPEQLETEEEITMEETPISDNSLPLADEIEEIDISDIEQSDFGEELPELEIETVGDSFLEAGKKQAEVPAKGEEEPAEQALDIEIPEEEFSDIEAFTEEVGETVSASPSASQPRGIAESQTTSILLKIEEELLSIRQELTALKNELSGLKLPAVAVEKPEPETPSETRPAGFFEEDEDETIALTGDELDNILNTADITEETGEGTTLAEEGDLLLQPQDSSLEIAEEIPTERGDIISTEEARVPVIESAKPEAEEDILDEIEIDIPEEELSLDEPAEAEEEIALEESEISLELPEIEDIEEEPASSLSEEPLTEDLTALEEEISADIDQIASGESLEEEIAEEELDLTELPEDISALAETEEEETILDNVQEIEIVVPPAEEEPAEPRAAGKKTPPDLEAISAIPNVLKEEIRSVLAYMDQLLESLPEDKIQEFAESEHFEVYKKLFEELGLTT
jgi:hypothetical protein